MQLDQPRMLFSIVLTYIHFARFLDNNYRINCYYRRKLQNLHQTSLKVVIGNQSPVRRKKTSDEMVVIFTMMKETSKRKVITITHKEQKEWRVQTYLPHKDHKRY